MTKKKLLSIGLGILASAYMLTIPAFAASDLDSITPTSNPGTAITTVTEQAPSNASTGNAESGAAAIGQAYSDLGMTEEDVAKAKELVSPVVKYVNIGIGVLAVLLGTILTAVTVIDLVYIVSPQFIRNIGSGGANAQQGGMGAMGAMGGMPMGGGAGGAPQTKGFAALISDDCRAALAESGADAGNAAGGGMSMGGGFGGMPMGGMPMGGMPMGGGAGGSAPKAKTVALVYLKKRTFTLVLIGVCAVVLTCTLFLDVGTTIGTWIVNLVSGAI